MLWPNTGRGPEEAAGAVFGPGKLHALYGPSSSHDGVGAGQGELPGFTVCHGRRLLLAALHKVDNARNKVHPKLQRRMQGPAWDDRGRFGRLRVGAVGYKRRVLEWGVAQQSLSARKEV